MKSIGGTVDHISEPAVEGEWSAEIERRVVEIDTGTVELIPWGGCSLRIVLRGKNYGLGI